MVNEGSQKQAGKWSIEQFLRDFFKKPLDSAAHALQRLGVTPNSVTMLGLVLNAAAAVLLGFGRFTIGGLVLLIGVPMDALDGALARLNGKPSPFGAFLDSVTDRYEELFLFAGLLVYFAQTGNQTGILLSFAAAAGSVLVSYVKARAESLGFESKVGLFSRVGRMIVLLGSLIFSIPLVGLWILAIFTNITAIHRFLHVRNQAIGNK